MKNPMYLSSRAVIIRNLSVASLNGTITLIILLIAPLGLASVIVNTLLVTIASFLNASFCDRIICFLQPDLQNKRAYREYFAQSSSIKPTNPNARH